MFSFIEGLMGLHKSLISKEALANNAAVVSWIGGELKIALLMK